MEVDGEDAIDVNEDEHQLSIDDGNILIVRQVLQFEPKREL